MPQMMVEEVASISAVRTGIIRDVLSEDVLKRNTAGWMNLPCH
jgi:hypothetical protein